jgi:hypothetical protein
MPIQAQRGDGGIAPSHSQAGARRRWVVSATLRPLYPRERPCTHCTGGWVGNNFIKWIVWRVIVRNLPHLSAFEALREATIRFVMAACLSVYLSDRMGNSAPTGGVSMKFDMSVFPKSVEKTQVSLKSDKNNGYFTWRHTHEDMYIYDCI